LADLERQLLADPFSEPLRSQYALALELSGQIDAAAKQYGLLRSDDFAAVAKAGVERCRSVLQSQPAGQPPTQPQIDAATEHAIGAAEPEVQHSFAGAVGTAREGVAEKPAATLHLVENLAPVVALPVQLRPRPTSFDDIVGMDALKRTLRLQIVEPFRNPSLYAKLKKTAGGGVLLYGPPGCGKTMIARGIATECRANFVSVGISDVLSMWLGESERHLAEIFERARLQRPCVVFFDELDALAFSRSKSTHDLSRGLVNEFLSQLDGFESHNQDILFLAATNMPWDVDPAFKRPGRFARQIFVPPPDGDARLHMLRAKLDGVTLVDVDLAAAAKGTHLFSGADLDGIIELAKENAIHRGLQDAAEACLVQSDFDEALAHAGASTTDWLRTARNLVRYSGGIGEYKDLAAYLKSMNL